MPRFITAGSILIRRALDTPAAGDGPPEAETRKSA